MIVMKGLPLAYSKDMQEDKEGTFDAIHSLSLCIAAMTGMVSDFIPDLAKMREAAGSGYAIATDLADWLVRALGLPFRQAHHVTGALVHIAANRKLALEELSLSDMQVIEGRITADVFSVLGVEKSVSSRTSYGGTAPANVKVQAESWLARLKAET
jgi:argininosuccinate lyase